MSNNQKSLKILMVAPQPFFRARGTPFSVLHRIRALVEAGHRVDLVTYPFGESIKFDGLKIFRSSAVLGISDVKIGPTLAKLALDVPLYSLTVQLLKENQYDFIHSHEEAAFFCVNLARRFELPHIYDMHSSLPQQLDNFGKFNFWPVRSVFDWLENRVLETCDGVITICDDLARVIEEKDVAVPHRMIENTADDRKVFSADGFDARERWGLEHKEVVLYTGTFEAYQGLDLLVDAFAILANNRPEAHLLMVGGTREQVDGYSELVNSRSLADRVTFTGTVHPSEIPAYIAASNLIVSPRSSGTNTPLKIYGYMRTGKPIVATDRWTHTQILSQGTAKLVPADAEGLSRGMLDILRNKEEAERLAQKAQEFAEREFSDESYVNKVLGLYRDVIDDLSSSVSATVPAAD